MPASLRGWTNESLHSISNLGNKTFVFVLVVCSSKRDRKSFELRRERRSFSVVPSLGNRTAKDRRPPRKGILATVQLRFSEAPMSTLFIKYIVSVGIDLPSSV